MALRSTSRRARAPLHERLGFEEVTKTEPEKRCSSRSRRRAAATTTGASRRGTGAAATSGATGVDFKRTKDGVPAKVAAVEYDPNRSARIALLHYADGAKAYILAPARLRVGSRRVGPERGHQARQRLPLANIPTGTLIHNVELKPGRGGQMARSAGSAVQLVAKDDAVTASCACRPVRCAACCSRAARPSARSGTPTTRTSAGGKAGRSRWRGKRPTVRGSAMNPVDHPHGGGEGKSKGGRHPVTPWGVPTLGKRTRRKHKESDKLIVRGRRRGKEKRR